MRCAVAILSGLLAGGAAAQDAPRPFASFAGASAAVLSDPHDLAFGPDGRLYVADKFAGRIAILDPEDLTLVGSFGEGALSNVHDISFGTDGRAYVAVTGLNGVAVYDMSTDPPTAEGLLGPFPRTEGALAHSNGRLYAMASGTGQIVAVADGAIVAAAGGLFGAHDVAEGPDGSVWVADNRGRRLVRFSEELEELGSLGDARHGFVGPRYLDVDEFGRLVVADQDAHRVLLIDPVTGDVEGILGSGAPGLGPGLFDDPEGVAVRGNAFYISDSDNNRIVKYVVVVN